MKKTRKAEKAQRERREREAAMLKDASDLLSVHAATLAGVSDFRGHVIQCGGECSNMAGVMRLAVDDINSYLGELSLAANK